MVGWSHYVIGALIALVGVAALSNYQLWEEWVDLVLVMWLIVSPWVLGFTSMAALIWNAMIVGAIVAILLAWALFTGSSTMRTT